MPFDTHAYRDYDSDCDPGADYDGADCVNYDYCYTADDDDYDAADCYLEDHDAAAVCGYDEDSNGYAAGDDAHCDDYCDCDADAGDHAAGNYGL